MHEFIKNSALNTLLAKIFPDNYQDLISMIMYRLSMQSAMYNAKTWEKGNVVKILIPRANLSSQNTSKIFSLLSKEEKQHLFFQEYLTTVMSNKERGIIIDATSLPNQINTSFNAWGHADGSIEKQFRFLCVVEQTSKKPLFYRYLPGNITDIVTLQHTIEELSVMGVKNSFALLDAGYCSKTNIQMLYNKKIDFLTRLPASRKLYKELLQEHSQNLESVENNIVYGKRGLFVKQIKTVLYEHNGFAYLILDPLRKGKEINEKILELDLNKNDGAIIDNDHYSNCGIMILISSKEIDRKEVISNYYLRQSVEQVFGFFKDDLDSLPIRRHNEETIKGYLFLQFLTLILFIELRQKLEKKYTVEKALLKLRNLKCKVFANYLLIAEATKEQKEIFKLCGILVPNKMGI